MGKDDYHSGKDVYEHNFSVLSNFTCNKNTNDQITFANTFLDYIDSYGWNYTDLDREIDTRMSFVTTIILVVNYKIT